MERRRVIVKGQGAVKKAEEMVALDRSYNAEHDESAALRGVYGSEDQKKAMDRARFWANFKPPVQPSDSDHDYSIFGD